MIHIALLIAASTAEIVPLQPSDRWVVAYEKTACLASRKFGPGGALSLQLRAWPLGDGIGLTFVRAGAQNKRVVSGGTAKLSVQPQNRQFETSYTGGFSPSAGGRVLIVDSGADLFDALSDDAILSMQAAGEEPIAVSTQQIAKLKPVIADCRRVVLKSWGVDPTILDVVGTRPELIDKRSVFFTIKDYPADALQNGQSGEVTILWAIDTEGKAKDCRPILSSGVPSLDRAACDVVQSRARYTPALDRQGKPMSFYGMRKVVWNVPRSSP